MCKGPWDVIGVYLPPGELNEALRPVGGQQAWVMYGLCDPCTQTFTPDDIEYKLVSELNVHVDKWGEDARAQISTRGSRECA
jgi:hypothetical protein